MTELSIQYACSPVTGDYGNLTVENLAAMNLFLGNVHNTETGVVYWTDASYVPQVTTSTGSLTNPVDGLLEPTEAAGVVSIDTGVANVNGYLYFNDVSKDFDIDGSPGNANATDIIALRWTATSQTVRLVRLNGAVGATAVLTQSSTTWEVPIAEVALDGSGNFSALTDVRRTTLSNSTVMPIETIEFDGSINTYTFSNIPPFFSHLLIRGFGKITWAVSEKDTVGVRFNGDSGNNYGYRALFIVNTAFTHSAVAIGSLGYMVGAQLTTTTGLANAADAFEIQINDYKNTTFFKTLLGQGQAAGDGTTGALGLAGGIFAGWWEDTSIITSVTLFSVNSGNFVSGSKFSLYGVV